VTKPNPTKEDLDALPALAGLAVIGAFASSYANPVQNSREERKIAMTM